MTTDILLPLGLAFIMFAVGLGLSFQDFKDVLSRPKVLMVGLGNQMVLLPVVGLLLVSFYQGPAEFMIGIMVLVACPGGVTSNFISVLAHGNAALSVSLTAITSLCSILLVPLILLITSKVFGFDQSAISMPIERIMAGLFMITALPMVLGMALKHFMAHQTFKILPLVRSCATIIFALLVAASFVMNKEHISAHFLDIGLFLILLNVIVLFIGYKSAMVLGCGDADARTISLECGLQNVALALFIGATIMENQMIMIPAIIYALVMNVSVALFIYVLHRQKIKTLSS